MICVIERRNGALRTLEGPHRLRKISAGYRLRKISPRGQLAHLLHAGLGEKRVSSLGHNAVHHLHKPMPSESFRNTLDSRSIAPASPSSVPRIFLRLLFVFLFSENLVVIHNCPGWVYLFRVHLSLGLERLDKWPFPLLPQHVSQHGFECNCIGDKTRAILGPYLRKQQNYQRK
jgi:hypothetical protein